MKLPPAPPENETVLDALFAGQPGAERRKMFGYASYFVNGQLAGGLFGDSMMLRMAPQDIVEFLKIKGAVPFAPMQGRVMKSYVQAPKSMMKEASLKPWVAKCVAFTASLPPKEKKAPKARAAKRA